MKVPGHRVSNVSEGGKSECSGDKHELENYYSDDQQPGTKKTSLDINSIVECVDLVDSDSDDIMTATTKKEKMTM